MEDTLKEVPGFKMGCRLIEIFSVRFVNFEQLNPAKIHGMMMLDCAAMPYVLLERFPGDPLPVHPNGVVEFTGPSHVHVAYDCIDFVALFCDMEGHFDQVDGYLWNGHHRHYQRLRNMLLTERWDTMFGRVEVNFAVLSNSTEVHVEIKLLDWRGKGRKYNGETAEEIEVFGAMTARNRLITDERATVYMFKREKEMCALVRPGEALPLSRSCVACPVRSSILLELDVRLCHPSDNDSASGSIVKGRVEVPASWRDEKIVLEGDCGSIQLNIAGGW